jgi:hypothetical protein
MTWFLKHRFKILLASLLTVLVLLPVIVDFAGQVDPRAKAFLVFGFTSLFLLASLLVLSDHRRTLMAALCILVPTLVFGTLARFLEPGRWIVLDHLLRMGFHVFVIVVLLGYLFRPGFVTLDTVSASLCVYLVLGVLWENVFSILETLRPGSIVLSDAAQARTGGSASDLSRTMEMLYFSYATLTSLGYGDIVPKTSSARMFAVAEALTGQLYLVVMVSRLVSMYGTQAFAPPVSREPESGQEDVGT